MVKGALDLASDIAEKSPIAVQGTKTNLIYSRDHSVQEGLEYIVSSILSHLFVLWASSATWNLTSCDLINLFK